MLRLKKLIYLKKAQRAVLNAVNKLKNERIEKGMELKLEEIKNKIKYLCDTNELIKTYLDVYDKDWYGLYILVRKHLDQYIL